MTLATRANMRKFEAEHPGVRAVALDLDTDEAWSASAGDYFTMSEHEPLRNESGEPLLLVVPTHGYRDVLTNAQLR